MLSNTIFDFILGLKGGSELAPELAERWEAAPDGQSYTLYLRKGIKFQNGEDFGADDVKFSLERYAAKESTYSEVRRMVDRMEVVDASTLRIYTKGTQPFFLYMIAAAGNPAQGLMMPKDYIERQGIEYFMRHPVGTGPYKFVRHVGGDIAEYEAVDKHWRQTPTFKRLSVILMPEETTRLAALKTGEIDATEASLDAIPELESLGFKIFPLQVWTPMINLHGAYDPRAAGMPITDIRVRQALSLAINRDEIRKSFFFGKADPPPPPYLFNGAADLDNPFWMDYAAKAYRYDPEEAKKLLKEAGYANGFNIKLYTTVIRGAPFLPKLGEIVAGYWMRIGVKAELVPVDWGVFQGYRARRDPLLLGQAATFRYADALVTPQSLSFGYHSVGTHGLFHPGNPEFDKLIDSALGESDAAKRKDLVAKATKIATDSYVSLMIAEVPGLSVFSPRIDIAMPKPAYGIPMYAYLAKPAK